MNFKIVNKSLYLCDNFGNIGRLISDSVNFATYDETNNIFLITNVSGRLETKDINGNNIRVIAQEVLEARFQGSDILIRKRDGRNVLVDKIGNIKRYY